MLLHTLQDWADLTGCYAAVDLMHNGWVTLYEKEPEFCGNCWQLGTMKGRAWFIDAGLVTDYDMHDWRILVKPAPKCYPLKFKEL